MTVLRMIELQRALEQEAMPCFEQHSYEEWRYLVRKPFPLMILNGKFLMRDGAETIA